MKKQHVALTKCFFCGEGKDILLCTRYRHGEPVKDMSQFDGAVIDHEPYPKCAKHMKLGVILISVRDGESGDNPYRTGGFWVIRDEAINRIITDPAVAQVILRKRVCFIPDEACKIIGLLPQTQSP